MERNEGGGEETRGGGRGRIKNDIYVSVNSEGMVQAPEWLHRVSGEEVCQTIRERGEGSPANPVHRARCSSSLTQLDCRGKERANISTVCLHLLTWFANSTESVKFIIMVSNTWRFI